jgi:beta-N-acetylhexosaminidase
VLLGCEGPVLTEEERSFFARLNPFGFILFQRNCVNPDQVKALTCALRACVQQPALPIFIDQEGGRVARLKPPYWPSLPAIRTIGKLYERNPVQGREAMRLHSLVTAKMLRAVGINGNCAPVLDLCLDGASSAIGDRALSASPQTVADLGRVAIEAYLAEGVYPVIKHMPGHGRVQVDPHVDLPFVDTDEETLQKNDFVPFKKLHDAPMAMNCHVVFRALDPLAPVSLSPSVHERIIRGVLGFQGLLMTDDLAMGALKMPLEQRVRGALEAGADIALYCTGSMEGMRTVEESLPAETCEATLMRWARAQDHLSRAGAMRSVEDEAALRARLAALLDVGAVTQEA